MEEDILDKVLSKKEKLSLEFEKDEFIYNVFYNKHQSEFERTSNIERKTTSILGFIGILFGFVSASGLFLLIKIVGMSIFFLSFIFYLLALCSLMLSLFFGFFALYVKTWKDAPNLSHFMENYVKTNKPKNVIQAKLSASYEDAISTNIEVNNLKLFHLRCSFYAFGFAILMIFFFIINIVTRIQTLGGIINA